MKKAVPPPGNTINMHIIIHWATLNIFRQQAKLIWLHVQYKSYILLFTNDDACMHAEIYIPKDYSVALSLIQPALTPVRTEHTRVPADIGLCQSHHCQLMG